jgi:hypothetical protein
LWCRRGWAATCRWGPEQHCLQHSSVVGGFVTLLCGIDGAGQLYVQEGVKLCNSQYLTTCCATCTLFQAILYWNAAEYCTGMYVTCWQHVCHHGAAYLFCAAALAHDHRHLVLAIMYFVETHMCAFSFACTPSLQRPRLPASRCQTSQLRHPLIDCQQQQLLQRRILQHQPTPQQIATAQRTAC